VEQELHTKTTPTVPAKPNPPDIDVEEAQDIIFAPNPGPQTDFLAATEQEVLYGGAAGGEPKSWFYRLLSPQGVKIKIVNCLETREGNQQPSSVVYLH
jgi:hypothetical protein